MIGWVCCWGARTLCPVCCIIGWTGLVMAGRTCVCVGAAVITTCCTVVTGIGATDTVCWLLVVAILAGVEDSVDAILARLYIAFAPGSWAPPFCGAGCWMTIPPFTSGLGFSGSKTTVFTLWPLLTIGSELDDILWSKMRNMYSVLRTGQSQNMDSDLKISSPNNTEDVLFWQ